jgi:chorismate synthase
MAGNQFGQIFRITTFGESHGEALGVVIDGCPAGMELSPEDIQKELDRRRPGASAITSPRQETDRVRLVSGVFEGKTLGTPIALLFFNVDIDSSKYEQLKDLYRPGHADYTYQKKYGHRDWRGGGRASARETVARVAAGAVAKKFLNAYGIEIYAFCREIAGISCETVEREEIEKNPVRAADSKAAQLMEQAILEAKEQGESLGGIVEVIATGVPPGLGEPVFDKLDAEIAKALMSIPAAKGVEIGAGFTSSRCKGSENNDPIGYDPQTKRVVFKSNHSGGILGGISNGDEIVARLAIKATSSIKIAQQTIDKEGNPRTIQVEGRHDPCVLPRAVPIVEAMLALVLADHLLRQRTTGLTPLD